jgi:D-glycero-beta-D-manno-heptose 1-phosphate adenylyltransferase
MRDSVYRSRALFVDALSLEKARASAPALLGALSTSFRIVPVNDRGDPRATRRGATEAAAAGIARFASENGIELYASWLIGEVQDCGLRGVLPGGRRIRSSLEAVRRAEDRSPVIVGPGRLQRLAVALRHAGKRIVFTNGVFDLLHVGHLRLLERARELGDVLVVAINSDDSTRRIKGPGRPVVHQFARAELLVRLKPVDYCLIFTESDPRKTLSLIKPDILVKGSDYTLHGVVGARYVAGYGGKVVRVPLLDGLSTTRTIRSISGRHGAERRSAAALDSSFPRR